jgi:hypothetical protein
MSKKLAIYTASYYGNTSIRFRNEDTQEDYSIDTYGLLKFLQEKFTDEDFKNIPIARKYRKMTEEQTYNHLKGINHA